MSTELGRLPAAQAGQKILHDAPEKQISAMLSKQDEIIAALKALTAKLDLDATVTDADYAATISDGLNKIQLHL
jgi:hypothetical protein